MPYIKQEARERLDYDMTPRDAGELNYFITVKVDEYLKDKGVSYKNLNEAIGVLECAKLELYRRIVSIYEDQKINDNGEVYECL